ncbi:response regulator transcription factor [Clostridium sp. 19966]|uniref:response regulator transcription factor n=1 Tax=Clostridium sp. 19966 TaxID=2768166 RepID=UPI0028DEE9BF|nr:response regulator transcription factor [Clostridium sp. 19966]MDT8718901.1 response regulator transcription factor [Clostridium sp. 19966]
MKKIKIALVDDERLITEGLKIILSSYEDLEVVGTGENGKEALKLCRTKAIDVVLMDIRMPQWDGVLGTKLIKEEFKNIKILILTTFNDVEYIHEALKYGACGYILKDSSYDLIHESIKAAMEGTVVVHQQVANKILENTPEKIYDDDEICNKYDMSHKELSIIREIANGLSNKEIAEKLFLTEGTIKNNISTILSKLSLRDRTQLAIFAFKNGISD